MAYNMAKLELIEFQVLLLKLKKWYIFWGTMKGWPTTLEPNGKSATDIVYILAILNP